MAGNNISVAITADTADLRVKLALASADVKAFTAETKSLAAQMREAGDAGKATLLPQLQASAAAAAAAQVQVRLLSAEMRGGRTSADGMISALGEYSRANRTAMADEGNMIARLREFTATSKETVTAHEAVGHASAGVTRELIVLAHEMSQGNFSKFGGSLMVLAERMGGLSMTTLGYAAGLAAVGLALFEITKSAVQAESALRAVNAAASFHGIDLGKAQIKGLIDEVHKLPGVTMEDAEKVVASFAGMRNTSVPLIQAMVGQVQLFAAATGQDMPEAAKHLAEAFGEPIKRGDKFLETIQASRTAIAEFDAAAAKGDNVAALAVMLTALAEGTGRVQEATGIATQKTRFWTSAFAAFEASVGMTSANLDELDKKLKTIDAGQVAKVAKEIDAATSAAAVTAKPTGAPLDMVRDQIQQAKALNEGSQADILRSEIATWQQRIAIGDLYGKELTAAQSALAQAQSALRRENGQEAIAETRLHISEMQAAGTLGRTELLKAETQAWSTLLAGDKLTAAQRVTVQRDLNLSLAQLHGTQAAEHLKALEAVTAAARKGSAARVAAAQAEVDFAVAKYKEGSQQAIAAQEHHTEALRAQALERVHVEAKAINDQIIAIDRALQAQIKNEDAKVKVFKQGIAERTRIELEAADDAERRSLALINREIAALTSAGLTETVEYQSAEDRRTAILERAEQQRQAIRDRGSEMQLQRDERDAQAWSRSLHPVGTAFDGLMHSMMAGRQTLNQALLSAASTWVTSELAADAKLLFSKTALFAAERLGFVSAEAAKAVTAKQTDGGILASLLLRTGAEKTATATATAAEVAGKATEVGAHVGAEAAKTGATVTGVAVRTAAEEAGAAESLAISAATAIKTIAIDAYEAAAGAYAAISAIPYVGPVLAPVAAAVALAAVIGFGKSITSAEGGMLTVPADGTLISAHKDESVIPAAVAGPMRQFFSAGDPKFTLPGALATPQGLATGAAGSSPGLFQAGSPGSSGPGGGDIHLHVSAVDGQSVRRLFMENSGALSDAIRRAVRNADLKVSPSGALRV